MKKTPSTTDTIELDFIAPELMQEIVVFENFLHKIGFKRLDGAVFGLLVLSSRPLTSEEIEKALGLSQSAVSLSLKNLIHFGAVETRDSRQSRAKLHRARENALEIVASVFRKREQDMILELKHMTQRSLKKVGTTQGSRARRLQSMQATCELAEAVIQFVYTLSKLERFEQVRPIVTQFPRTLDMLIKTTSPLASMAQSLGGKIFENLTLRSSAKDNDYGV